MGSDLFQANKLNEPKHIVLEIFIIGGGEKVSKKCVWIPRNTLH